MEIKLTTMKQNINWKHIWWGIRKYLLNKYIITLIIFAVIMVFIGDQSLLVRLQRARQIHKLEQQRDNYCNQIEQAQHDIEILQNKDSLERFAREQYYMHTPEEEVFIIEN